MCVWDVGGTLEGGAGLLGQGEVLLAEVVDGLVLVDLYAGAHIAVAVQEEAEGAREMLTGKGERDRERKTEKEKRERERMGFKFALC